MMGPTDRAPPWGDPWLEPYRDAIEARRRRIRRWARRLTEGRTSLADFASGHTYFGLHRTPGGWRLAEWAPAAEAIYLVGDVTGWEERERFRFRRLDGHGRWELVLPPDALCHGQHYKLRIHWAGGAGDRIPAWARRVVQDPETGLFSAQVWAPDRPYRWRHPPPEPTAEAPLVYEAHVGMAQEREGVGTYAEFRDRVLPRIVRAGYNTVQLMAVAEHPYYGSFGYHVSSFFAASSRFGTPEELKSLVDAAHGLGLRVTMDLVHSHAVKNENEGLGRYDGTRHQFFHAGPRGEHPVWDSLLFDYGKPEVLHFLLSNCRFWLDEYRMDGFRFDGITSMLFLHHGLGHTFSGYDEYFGPQVDEDAYAYLALANEVVHQVRPDALTVAEDVSGMPGLCAPVGQGGAGFDRRLAMGVPDCWFRLVREVPDEAWDLGWLWHELNNRRPEERVVSYAESHDQALVGGKTLIFELIGDAMYGHMRRDDPDLRVERGVALHKMIRLATLATAGHGYLAFMGNEFGHPEWVDFPREGNRWSYRYARRQWSLADDPDLRYHGLAEFDRQMIGLARQEGFVGRDEPQLLVLRPEDEILAFARGRLFFFFNFHPTRSRTEYPVEVPAGAYDLVLDTDEPRFAGPGRLVPGQRFFTHPLPGGTLGIRLYLPSRCALVLRREGG